MTVIQAAQSITGLVLYSPDPDELAAFYRDALGVPLALTRHGTVGDHYEGMLGGSHMAIWDAAKPHGLAPTIPVFRVHDIEHSLAALEGRGAKTVHRIIDIGEGKKLATFTDPDGRPFRLIRLG
jgi:predicted enzyme related to lactoylglutathione lyase